MRDFKRLQEDPPAGVAGAPGDNNIMLWNAVIFGPHDTPFEDGTFKLTIEFTEEYPNKPPTVRFISRMFHPNVYADGGICLDILQNRCGGREARAGRFLFACLTLENYKQADISPVLSQVF